MNWQRVLQIHWKRRLALVTVWSLPIMQIMTTGLCFLPDLPVLTRALPLMRSNRGCFRSIIRLVPAGLVTVLGSKAILTNSLLFLIAKPAFAMVPWHLGRQARLAIICKRWNHWQNNLNFRSMSHSMIWMMMFSRSFFMDRAKCLSQSILMMACGHIARSSRLKGLCPILGVAIVKPIRHGCVTKWKNIGRTCPAQAARASV